MRLVMFVKDKQPRAGVIDGEDIVDINACDRSLPPTLKGILEANGLVSGQENPQVEEESRAAQPREAPAADFQSRPAALGAA